MTNQPESSLPTTSTPMQFLEDYRIYQNYEDPLPTGREQSLVGGPVNGLKYPSWCAENHAMFDEQEIYTMFKDLGRIFGFQNDNVANIHDAFMMQLDSRSSRMTCPLALLSIHVDYIGGDTSNFKKWSFAAQIDMEQSLSPKHDKKLKKRKVEQNMPYALSDLEDENSLLGLEFKWKHRMNSYTDKDYIYQIGLYLLMWGEANNIRFMPECLCYLYSCAFNHFYAIAGSEHSKVDETNKPNYLNNIINPLYNFLREQQYDLIDSRWIRNQKDHSSTIGYDDMNQLFWFPEGLKKIKLMDGSFLHDTPKHQVYASLAKVDWKRSFYKTYSEKRTWSHALTNFSRIWVIHITIFWYYTCFNSPTLYTVDYNQLLDNQPAPQVQWSAVALGGSICCTLTIVALFNETRFVPRKWSGSQPVFGRIILLLLLLVVNLAPSVYIFGFLPLDVHSQHGTIIGIVQFVLSVVTFLYLSIVPPSRLFSFLLKERPDFITSKVFTASFARLKPRSRIFSYLLWVVVFAAKFTESYFFLTLSLRDAIRVLSIMDLSRCTGDIYFGNSLCKHQAKFTLVLLYIADLVLFFLDTYLWYIICNCIFSVGLSFSLGLSIFTPWRNIFARLPDRIATKLVYANSNEKVDSTLVISKIWNCIILSIYREHLLSAEQVNRLVFQSLEGDISVDQCTVKPPLFFVYQDDMALSLDQFFPAGQEAERRISFFAQSISIPLPEPVPTSAMPSFTVLIPHYAEKIVLNLNEVMKDNKDSKVTLLDYLKQLHPQEWSSFVKDSKLLPALSTGIDLDEDSSQEESKGREVPSRFIQDRIDDIPYYYLGFKDSSPDMKLRTRLWCSLRYQTLYRTVSGFMNYSSAIKLLYGIDNNDIDSRYLYMPDETSQELTEFTQRKFNLLIAMQRYQHLSADEKEDAHFLFATYPSVLVAYLEEEKAADGTVSYYSTLLDTSSGPEQGEFRKKYRIKLSGDPILGDGKSDNQNSALIYYRGEYLQVIDANQDNYLEECLKIKAVLAEFEEMHLDPAAEYVPGIIPQKVPGPVAIVGAREYIFSENVGVLGDIAAGKEQTFGTLFARTLAEIGAKLHYGHPDFLNAIYMTTRGGVSKSQKSLHLNEDIYAGMMVLSRGGRIKHCDYYQCGKGRDLGFGTILNFTTKIGAGMGEQMLSREYFYLGTQLPIDRFLSFYYAHPGFHINNVFITLSIQLFMLVLVNLGALTKESIVCSYNSDIPLTDVQQPLGCYQLQPVLNWITRFVMSVFICFFISFVPLVIQELIEKGFAKAVYRVFYHIISMAPLFEVFVCQIYAKALRDNLTFGGAKYIATGRGFATKRLSFASLYSKYADSSIYSGFGIFLTILFATISIWQPSLLWFWITIISMCLAPFIFNPHQFEWGEFFLDYREFIRWLSRGNNDSHKYSWIEFTRAGRSKYTGNKKKSIEHRNLGAGSRGPKKSSSFVWEVCIQLVICFTHLIPFMFINSQNGVVSPQAVNPLVRIMIISISPFVFNSIALSAFWLISAVFRPILGCCTTKVPTIIAGTVHFITIVFNIVNIEVLLVLEGFNYSRALCGVIFMLSLHRAINKIIFILFLSKELNEDYSNAAWWSGKWLGRGLGWMVLTQPIREFVVKILESNSFTQDFILGHVLLFSLSPFLFVPFIDKWHSVMLFWLKPNAKFHGPIYNQRLKNKRRLEIFKYCLLFFTLMIIMIILVVGPVFAEAYIPDFRSTVPEMVGQLFQPNHQNNNDTGEFAPSAVARVKPEYVVIRKVW